jgi:hypothetical protein
VVDEAIVKRKRAVTRSPQYPAFGLETALNKVNALYDKERMHPAPFTVAIEDMGYSATGSTGLRALAALSHFGLVEQEGSGSNRTVRVSRLARDILLDDRAASPEREAAIREAALTPTVYAALYQKFGVSMPSIETVKLWLIRDLEFNPEAVGSLVADYRATMEFAKLDDPMGENDIVGEGAGGEQDLFSPPPPTKQAGSGGKETNTMPAIDTLSEPWDLNIPLRGGRAILRVPTPLTVENLTLLQEAVKTMLDFQKKVLGYESDSLNESGQGGRD